MFTPFLAYFIFNPPNHKDSSITPVCICTGTHLLPTKLKSLLSKIPQIHALSISIYSKDARLIIPSLPPYVIPNSTDSSLTKSLYCPSYFLSHSHTFYFNTLLADGSTHFQPLHTLSNICKELPEFTSICPLRNSQCPPTVLNPNPLAKCSR